LNWCGVTQGEQQTQWQHNADHFFRNPTEARRKTIHVGFSYVGLDICTALRSARYKRTAAVIE